MLKENKCITHKIKRRESTENIRIYFEWITILQITFIIKTALFRNGNGKIIYQVTSQMIQITIFTKSTFSLISKNSYVIISIYWNSTFTEYFHLVNIIPFLPYSPISEALSPLISETELPKGYGSPN